MEYFFSLKWFNCELKASQGFRKKISQFFWYRLSIQDMITIVNLIRPKNGTPLFLCPHHFRWRPYSTTLVQTIYCSMVPYVQFHLGPKLFVSYNGPKQGHPRYIDIFLDLITIDTANIFEFAAIDFYVE